MPLTISDLLAGLRDSRRHFLKHVAGLTPEQWSWKPYPECKSVVETLAHLVIDDRAALQALESGHEPDYTSIEVEERDPERLLALLSDSHAQLCAGLSERFAGSAPDAEMCVWGLTMSLGRGVPFLSSEDWYHSGQVAFIRMATDPEWDYYAHIYGAGE